MEYELVNLTGHDIVLINEEAFKYDSVEPTVKLVIPPSGALARIGNKTKVVDRILYKGRSIDITSTKYGGVTGLPEPKPGVLYIVSKLVAEEVFRYRDDILIMSGIYRDKKTKAILGCRGLAKLYNHEITKS